MDRRETGWESVDWMHRTYDRDQWRASFCEYGNETSGSIKREDFLD